MAFPFEIVLSPVPSPSKGRARLRRDVLKFWRAYHDHEKIHIERKDGLEEGIPGIDLLNFKRIEETAISPLAIFRKGNR